MNRSASPGLGQWITVLLLVTMTVFLFFKLYQFAGAREYYPTGLTIAGVDVGGMNREEASTVLNNRYLEAPIIIYHGENKVEISPTDAEFTLDLEAMLSQADYQRFQQDFWAGFWGFLWGRPVEVDPVPLYATHNREELRETLKSIATLTDQPAQPPQPIPATMSFQFGESGTKTNIEASFSNVEAALYRPSSREARLIVEPLNPDRPDINLLTRLMVNYLQDFETTNNGVASVFIYDLNTGQELSLNADMPMSGTDVLRIPIVLELYRQLDNVPTLLQRQLISDTLVIQPDVASANQLLGQISGTDDAYAGAEQVTNSLQKMGLVNSYILTPFGEDPRAGQRPLTTPANSSEEIRTQPGSYAQMTAEDIGLLLADLYYCAQGKGGTITAVFTGDVTQEECQEILNYMSQNNIESLFEEGVPKDVTLAHRHGWISDTHSDAGIVFTPGGNYVIVGMLYKPDWLEWETSSPILSDISRAAYNYFNYSQPYFGGLSTAN
ncbi:MAG: serine hydrolase [Anaerolineae bacterium]|nr:serine hydrolase [Anaerolineae bacterium]